MVWAGSGALSQGCAYGPCGMAFRLVCFGNKEEKQMDDGITVKEFKHIPGVNDAEYIKKLEELHENDRRIISIAVAKIKKLSSQLKEQPKCGKWIERGTWSEGEGMGETYGKYWACNQCGRKVKGFWDECGKNFCDNCGADMRGNTE